MGRGSKDHTLTIAKAFTANYLTLEATEELKVFMITLSEESSLFNWWKSPLASLATIHLIDTATGLDLPYTVPAGYEFKIMMVWASFDGPTRSLDILDGVPYTETYFPESNVWMENDIITFEIGRIDPTHASAHTVDIIGKNLGDEDLVGTGIVACVQEAVGTSPLPTTKMIRCKWCGALTEVLVATKKHKCQICGKETWYL